MDSVLPSPVLNISGFYFASKSNLFGYDWVDPRSAELNHPFQDPSNATLASSNQTYSLVDVETNGRCQPIQDVGHCPVKEY